MASRAGIRPNHYEVLGLNPSASDGEIARAFADAMSMFRVRPVTALAEIGAAYETLRNPAKRREYDRSIGLSPPAPAPRQWAIAAPAVRWAPLAGSPAFAPPPAEQPAERDPVSAIAASLREIARPDALEPSAVRKAPRAEVPKPASEAAIPHFLAEPRADPEVNLEVEERAIDWKRPALAVGGLVVAAGLFGTVAGLSVRDSAQPFGAQSITAAIPAVKARAPSAAPAAVAETSDADVQAPVRSETPPQLRRVSSRRATPRWVEQSAEAEPAASAPARDVTEQAAADPLAPQDADSAGQPVAASLPLPNGVVARTIERIGYSCGKVASSAAVDGSPGVFTVTCSSGQSYQASPVHGRYRFRRLGGH